MTITVWNKSGKQTTCQSEEIRIEETANGVWFARVKGKVFCRFSKGYKGYAEAIEWAKTNGKEYRKAY